MTQFTRPVHWQVSSHRLAAASETCPRLAASGFIRRPRFFSSLIAGVCLWFLGTLDLIAIELPGPQPTDATADLLGDQLLLGNSLLRYSWDLEGGVLKPARVTDVLGNKSVDLRGKEVFRLVLADGTAIRASDLGLVGRPKLESLAADPAASILAHRFPGRQWTARLVSRERDLEVEWRAILRDGANAIRQELRFLAKSSPILVKEARLIELPKPDVTLAGIVPGSPLVVGNLFFAYEHPDAQSAIGEDATSGLAFNVALQPGQPVQQSFAVGVVPSGQLRRGFLYYLERERAHPYRPFLHYNAWYDICWDNRKITEAECLQVVDQFGRELIQKRGVPLASFVWDDGWDDPKTLWRPLQQNFPNGFSKILARAREAGSTLGFWLSPFGGYGQAKQDRLDKGKAEGFEITETGFSLAGPKYYGRFEETCLNFIERDGANFFKFDGLAKSVHETEAMLRLSRALRSRKPDLFISITTGTWPSPFWLWYGDSTWRGGDDMGFTGAGSKREQWITYRDRETYGNVVRPAPLYPINSLMTQGFAHARYGTALAVGDDAGEIQRELRSFFASGTCLQELYVTPSKMTAHNWDDLAECARWAQANREVLVDTHWVGGDPGKAQVYGWASWTPRKGILALRNPSDKPGDISIDVAQAFELPAGAAQSYALTSPWQDGKAKPALALRAGQAHTFELAAFEVLVLEALPERP